MLAHNETPKYVTSTKTSSDEEKPRYHWSIRVSLLDFLPSKLITNESTFVAIFLSSFLQSLSLSFCASSFITSLLHSSYRFFFFLYFLPNFSFLTSNNLFHFLILIVPPCFLILFLHSFLQFFYFLHSISFPFSILSTFYLHFPFPLPSSGPGTCRWCKPSYESKYADSKLDSRNRNCTQRGYYGCQRLWNSNATVGAQSAALPLAPRSWPCAGALRISQLNWTQWT